MSAQGPDPFTGRGLGARLLLLLVVVTLTLAGAGAYAVTAFQQARTDQGAPALVEVTTTARLPSEPFVMFRNTAPGHGNGEAAIASLADPNGSRALTGQTCDRVYATRQMITCLATRHEFPTSFEAATFGPALQPLETWRLAGVPSRTRINQDSSLLATTVFVSGHSYNSAGFSTETVIRASKGKDHGNLEDFALMVEGTQIMAADRNIWGVTFVPEQSNEFYATASWEGNVSLVRGDLTARTLTVVASGVECPSISPDGRHLAFKKSVSGTLSGERHPAVMELATGKVTLLGEQRDIDDQIEWLDAGTVLYGVDSGEDTDIWSIAISPGAAPEMFIEHAWSPAVVR